MIDVQDLDRILDDPIHHDVRQLPNYQLTSVLNSALATAKGCMNQSFATLVGAFRDIPSRSYAFAANVQKESS